MNLSETVSTNMMKVRSGLFPKLEDLLKVMETEPWLCNWGLANKLLCKIYKIDIEQNRESLTHYHLRGFQLSSDWLGLCEIRKRINISIPTSYTLKHMVEEWCSEYVSNGSFIAAVIHLGIPYKDYKDSPNIHVALSSKSKLLKESLYGIYNL